MGMPRRRSMERFKLGKNDMTSKPRQIEVPHQSLTEKVAEAIKPNETEAGITVGGPPPLPAAYLKATWKKGRRRARISYGIYDGDTGRRLG